MRNPFGRSFGNDTLRAALEKLARRPGAESRRGVLEALRSGPLLLAWREPPGATDDAPGPLDSGLTVRFVTETDSDSGPLLAAFSQPDAVAARAPAATWVLLEARAVLNWVFEAGHDGLVLDPNPHAFRVSRDDVLELLGMGEQRRERRRVRAASHGPEALLRRALAELLESEDTRASLAAREPRTGRHVHFARQEGGILMTVPAHSMAADELARVRLLFDELAGLAADELDEKPEPDSEPSDLPALLPDAERAATAAVKVFTWVFGFPASFDLEIDSSA